MLLTLEVSDALAQPSTLRAVQRLRRPMVRVAPRRVDGSAMAVRPAMRRLIALEQPVRPPGAPVVTICHMGASRSHPALIVLDGVVLGLNEDLTIDDSVAARATSRLESEDILSVEVVKGQRAKELYGERAHNGVVIITTKRKQLSTSAAVPAWSVEAVIGYGPETARAGAVYYNRDGSIMIRYAASVSFMRDARFSPYVKAEFSPDIYGDQLDICGIAPNGSCLKYPDNHDGVGIGLGARTALTKYSAIGVLVGFGKYDDRTRYFVETEATLNLAKHVGFVATARYMHWTRNGYPHYFAPITAGLQLF